MASTKGRFGIIMDKKEIELKLNTKKLILEVPIKIRVEIPIAPIALNRAENYKGEFDNNVSKSLEEDTIPYLNDRDGFASDWYFNNMDFDEVESCANICVPEDLPALVKKEINKRAFIEEYHEE